MKDQEFNHIEERFADLQLLRYKVEGFETLSLRQQTYIYHLAEATLWGRDILWDQNGRYNLRIRRLLEHVYLLLSGDEGREEGTENKGDHEDQEYNEFLIYLKRIWFSNGIHHHYACDKIQPRFSQSFLRKAIDAIPADRLPLEDGQSVEEMCQELFPVIFNPQVLPKRVNQAAGEDLLLTSASNYYQDGITQEEAEAFYARMKAKGDVQHPIMYGMNSKLVRNEKGELEERTWKLDGMYHPYIQHILNHLKNALPFAENDAQREVIRLLMEFYTTGDLHTFDRYTMAWVDETKGRVDFINGFTEVYGDPLGLKASWEGYVNFTDLQATLRTEKICQNAQWFEDHSPVDPRFKKESCQGVTARVVVAAILGGDLYPSSAIGINLPNSNWVRAEHGSKSVTIGNLTHAYDEAARGNGFREEFVIDQPTIKALNDYADVCDDLHTDLHECLGHGSGRLLPGIDPDALKAYGSTIEEARADLFGLYYMADQKLVDLGLTPNAEAYQAQYYSYLMNGLMTQLVRIEPGCNIEEAHMRNRALIAHWTLHNFPQALALVQREGKTYLQIYSYEKLREAFAQLLAEVQRIKSEGDYEAAKALVEDYGVKVDAKLHQEVLARYKALNLAPYKGFINPRYEAERDEQGNIIRVTPYYDESFTAQMLRYSKEYSL